MEQQQMEMQMQQQQHVQQQQQSQLRAQASTQQTEELEDQEIFVPLRQIGKVQRNALAEATAMAKVRNILNVLSLTIF